MSEHKQWFVTADIVLFTKIVDKLQVLLIRRKNPPYQGMWALPGGHAEAGEETTDQCALRELKEETGVECEELKQFCVRSGPGRNNRGDYLTIGYYGGVDYDKVTPKAADDAAAVEWHDVTTLPELAFDHKSIIEEAIVRAIEDATIYEVMMIGHGG